MASSQTWSGVVRNFVQHPAATIAPRGVWSRWGSCSECRGLRVVRGFDFATLTQQMPNHCGRPREPKDAKKVEYVMVIAKAKSCANACQWDYQHQSGRGLDRLL